jgi:hypothetical protein
MPDAHLHAVDRHLRNASPPRWRATPNQSWPLTPPVLRLVATDRAQRSERAFALDAGDSVIDEERRGPRTVPWTRQVEPPPTGRHVPRRESCAHFLEGLVFVVVGSVLMAWGFTALISYVRSLG